METIEEKPSPGWLSRVLASLTHSESPLRRRIRRRALAFPWYRTRRQLELLAELAELFRRNRTPCAFVGGFAVSALGGEFAGAHGDIDIAFLDRDSDVLFATLRGAGFKLRSKNPCSTGAWRKGFQLDLFHWRDAGEGRIVHVTSDVAVRMPERFLTETQDVQLNGVRFPIPSAAYLVSTLPFVQRPETQRFLQSLAATIPLETETRREQIDLTVNATVHESRPLPP